MLEYKGASKNMGKVKIQGKCNICSRFGSLTEDHVPPKGSVRLTQMMSRDMIQALNMDEPKKSEWKKKSQNGVKFPTLCEKCNTHLLGTHLDPEFIRFVKSINTIIQGIDSSFITLPPTINITCVPDKVIRAFLGHMTAIGNSRIPKENYCQSEFLREELGAYIKGEEKLPDDARVYCWPFPYKNQTLLRFHNVAHNIFQRGPQGVLTTWVMKFLPVAMMLVWKQPPNIDLSNLTCLSNYLCDFEEREKTIQLRIDSPVHQYWPETPRGGDIILSSTDISSIVSSPYSNAKRMAKNK